MKNEKLFKWKIIKVDKVAKLLCQIIWLPFDKIFDKELNMFLRGSLKLFSSQLNLRDTVQSGSTKFKKDVNQRT